MRHNLTRPWAADPQKRAPTTSALPPSAADDQALLGWILSRAVHHPDEDTGPDPDRPPAARPNRLSGLDALGAAKSGELAQAFAHDPFALSDLKLLRDLATRLVCEKTCRRPVITSSKARMADVRAAFAHVTTGHARVCPREVGRRALEISALAMIQVQNQFSGNPEPSRADIEMTRKIIDAARLFGLQVHDHLVICRQGTASFKQLRLI